MSLTGRFLFALLSATIPHSFAMTSRATTRALTFSSPTQRQFTSFIRRSLSNQIDIIPTTSTTTPHHDGRRMVQLTWPKCSKAKYYRITSMSDDKSKSFSLFSTVQYQSKWTIGQSQNQLTVTPIDNQGNEILDSKLIQRIVHEVDLITFTP